MNNTALKLLAPLLALLLWAASFNSAWACAVCVPYPTSTAADHLLNSDTVVLARENPERPWTYLSVETLKGEAGPIPIDHFVNSSTRRRLKSYPDRGVVLVRDKQSESGWRSLGFAEEAYEKMLREIIREAPKWQDFDRSGRARPNFFAGYLGDENRSVHELAYLEVGRAPYEQIRDLDSKWSLQAIRTLLQDTWYLEWRPLAILLLAINGTQQDHAYIARKFAEREQAGMTINLSAWTTALVEIQQEKAIEEIELKYFSAPDRRREELEAIVLALSEHGGTESGRLQDRIIQAYARLIDLHPEMAGYVVRDLLLWQRWDLADELQKTRAKLVDRDPITANAIRLYLLQASQGVLQLPEPSS